MKSLRGEIVHDGEIRLRREKNEPIKQKTRFALQCKAGYIMFSCGGKARLFQPDGDAQDGSGIGGGDRSVFVRIRADEGFSAFFDRFQ